LSYQGSNQNGLLAVYIDGVFAGNVNEYSAIARNQLKWNSPVLANGTHSVQMIHASGARVNLDAVLVRLTVAWPNVTLQQVVSGLSSPVDLVNAGDGSGRMFVVQQDGLIRIVQGGVVTGTFLDISSEISFGGERGLLSAAFPPNYSSSNHFYVYYTNTAGNLVLSRIGLTDANTANLASEQIVLTIPHPGQSNHNGGHLAFGPDGYLYLSTGDGGGGGDPYGNGQDTTALLGKMLRLDVETGSPATYTVPASNPFVGVAGADEIWAYGLRNPWRYSFDSSTGDLYIGDVGPDAWEEVDFQAAGFAGGANYGWNVWEGNHCYNPPSGCNPPANYVGPVAEYNHGSSDSYGCAITGGYVYRGVTYPTMQGVYFYSDYCTGRLLAMKNVAGTWVTTQLTDTPYNVSGFGVDEAGNLYLIDLGGSIYLIKTP
jgi:glucose/arabinose dehydrogenase